jgi:hypothetical protein
MSFSDAYALIRDTRTANAVPNISDAIAVPDCLSRIIVGYILPSEFEFANSCFFSDIYAANIIIVPVESDVPLTYLNGKIFLPVKIHGFYNLRQLILQFLHLAQVGSTVFGIKPGHQSDLINDKIVSFFEKEFFRIAKRAASNMFNLSCPMTYAIDDSVKDKECKKMYLSLQGLEKY